MEAASPGDIPYLRALDRAGPSGFCPVGWLYRSVLDGLVGKGLAEERDGSFFITTEGKSAILLSGALASDPDL